MQVALLDLVVPDNKRYVGCYKLLVNDFVMVQVKDAEARGNISGCMASCSAKIYSHSAVSQVSFNSLMDNIHCMSL